MKNKKKKKKEHDHDPFALYKSISRLVIVIAAIAGEMKLQLTPTHLQPLPPLTPPPSSPTSTQMLPLVRASKALLVCIIYCIEIARCVLVRKSEEKYQQTI